MLELTQREREYLCRALVSVLSAHGHFRIVASEMGWRQDELPPPQSSLNEYATYAVRRAEFEDRIIELVELALHLAPQDVGLVHILDLLQIRRRGSDRDARFCAGPPSLRPVSVAPFPWMLVVVFIAMATGLAVACIRLAHRVP